MALTRKPDPGMVFQFEDQRYVLGHLISPREGSLPLTLDEVMDRLAQTPGPYSDLDQATVQSILDELVQTEDVITDNGGYIMSDAGYAQLDGPNGFEPPPMNEVQVDAMQSAGYLTEAEVQAWREATADAA